MLFNSLQFLIFFVIIFSLYLMLKQKWQNRMLLVASCIFYSAWDWRFLFLIFISITTDYFCALKIYRTENEKQRKHFLLLSIIVNLSILGFFKYFNFFLDNLIALLNYFGITIQMHFIKIILPLGISFYTLKTLSYTFDVYRKEMKPVRSFLDYALFVIFFPQIIAGPIMRAKDLLPQILALRKLSFDKFSRGLYLILWGLIQKIFIADNLANIANPVFASNPPYNGLIVLIAVYAFAFQIFCDFAGYSNISIGLGRCMGFDTTSNFDRPYLSKNPADFWRRWHITLSTWLRDYLYTPIVVNRRYWGDWGIIFGLMVTLIVCGFWHGAAWTFVVWGAYHGLLLAIHYLSRPLLIKILTPKNVVFKKIWGFVQIVIFFHIICIGWIFFWAKSISQAFSMLYSIIFRFQLIPVTSIKFSF